MNDMVITIMFGVYIFAVLFFLGQIFFREEDPLERCLARIQAMGSAEEALQQEEKKIGRKLIKQPEWFHVSKRLQDELDGAGIYLSAVEYLGIWLAAATIIPIGCYLAVGQITIALIFLPVGFLAPPIIVRSLRKKRLERFGSQLGDALMVMGNCLRSGFSVHQSFERIVTDMPEPISEEFRLAFMEMNYGAPMEDVLSTMAARMENRNLELVTSGIIIQRRTGGNLSEIIDNVSETIRDRARIRRTLKTLTAQGRISGLVLGCLPVAALLGMTMLNPEYTGILYTTSFGHKLLILCICMETVGFYMINKIVNIRI